MRFVDVCIPKSHKRVIFEIQSKNGRNISKISEFNGIFNPENQHEVLFDKGTKFLVKKRRIEDGGTYGIILVEDYVRVQIIGEATFYHWSNYIQLRKYPTSILLSTKYRMVFIQPILQYGLHFLLIYCKMMTCLCSSCVKIFISWYL